jgi:uncharacterized protein YecE (DUF72 family)
VPNGFVFAVKDSRHITHMKKLKESQKALKNRPENKIQKQGGVST